MTRRRLVAVVVAVLFAGVLVSVLVYTQQMAEVLRRDAAVFSRLYALTFRAGEALDADPRVEDRLTSETLQITLREIQRLQIPVVFTDTSGTPTGSWAHLPFDADKEDPEDLRRVAGYARELDRTIPPLEFPGLDLRVHLGEPLFLRRLEWVPWLQAALLLAVVGGGSWLIFTSFRSERERIWSAMARESAHQMGTPLSSLVGWLEQLQRRREQAEVPGAEGAPAGGGGRAGGASEGVTATAGGIDVVAEMQADIERLQKVSRRFELIGRKPPLEAVSVGEILDRLRTYFSRRLPSLGRSVEFVIEVPPEAPSVRGNATLLEWAFENLIKNSLDALAGVDGRIGVAYAGTEGNRAVFGVYDTGPGVPPEVRKSLFEIGVSTKERGWGVGLSLTRRIIEDMHDGHIELEASEEGASFRIGLPVARDAEAAGGRGRDAVA